MPKKQLCPVMEIHIPVTFMVHHTLNPGEVLPSKKKELKKLLLEELMSIMKFDTEDRDDDLMLYKMGTPKIIGVPDWEEVDTK